MHASHELSQTQVHQCRRDSSEGRFERYDSTAHQLRGDWQASKEQEERHHRRHAFLYSILVGRIQACSTPTLRFRRQVTEALQTQMQPLLRRNIEHEAYIISKRYCLSFKTYS